ncbi:MAG: DUF6036 family nucleotidyltransferase [Vicinamibacterales bacterium]
MTRAALEHLLRAASALTNEREFVVIGSQAILGQFPEAPSALLVSIEADIYPRYAPEKSDIIDGAIGELSTFHQTFGYYAHGVDETTAILPAGWEKRVVPLHNDNTGGATGWCLEVHDLACSKLVAGRTRDFEFVGELLRAGMADRTVLGRRLGQLPLPDKRVHAIQERLQRLVASGA